MRFTKQLAVCIVAVAAFAIPPAHAQITCSISGDEHTGVEQSELTIKGLFGVMLETGLFGGLIPSAATDATAACDTPPYAGYLTLYTTDKLTLIKKQKQNDRWKNGKVVTHAAYNNINIKNTEIYTESRTIKGRTQDGVVRTIHCNPGNCTLGSLNRFSVLAGAPMMVPLDLYNFAAEPLAGDGADPAGVWKTIASIMWSEDFAKEDVNAASARTRHLADPTAYGRAQRALNAAIDDNRDGILKTIIVDTESDTASEDVTVSEEETASEEDTAVVVTETAVVCTSQGQTGCVDAHDL